jgi:hypothetical protein
MGTSQDPALGSGRGGRGGQRGLATAGGYLVLFVLGAAQGFIGSFQYGQSPSPLIAIVLIVVIFVTCLACGWGIGTFTAGLLPGVGWIVASFVLAMPKSNGSVIITSSAAGEWYLYGGSLACLTGAAAAFFVRVSSSARPR